MIEETKEERFERRLKERYSDPDLIAKKLKDHKKLIYKDKMDKENVGVKEQVND